jgi:hypothetical protein
MHREATVLLLTDSKSGVSVRLGNTGDRGGEGRWQQPPVGRARCRSRNDLVLTSTPGVFPWGIPVGCAAP